jgi:hypothetical protein
MLLVSSQEWSKPFYGPIRNVLRPSRAAESLSCLASRRPGISPRLMPRNPARMRRIRPFGLQTEQPFEAFHARETGMD